MDMEPIRSVTGNDQKKKFRHLKEQRKYLKYSGKEVIGSEAAVRKMIGQKW